MIGLVRSVAESISADLQRAESALLAGDLVSAKLVLKRCVIRDSRRGDCWELLGRVHFEQGNYPLAISALERAARQRPLTLESRVRLGRSFGKVGNDEAAVTTLCEVMADNSSTGELLLEIAIGLDSVNRPDLSIEACRRVLKRDPLCAQAYYDMGYYSGRCGTPPRTAEFLVRRAIQCDPSNVKYRIGLSGQLYKEGRLDEAYDVVRDLGLRQIAGVSCVLCLQRLVELFGRSNDSRRATLCDQRLTELRLQGCSLGY